MHVASWLASVLRCPHFNAVGKKPIANHTVDLQRAGSLTHADNQMVFVTKSLNITMDRIPMLLVCGFRTEPSSTMMAGRAPNVFNEVLPRFSLQIATATICDNPGFRAALNVTLVHSSHTFHRRSVNADENFVIIHLYEMHLSVKPLARGRRLAFWALFSHLSTEHSLQFLEAYWCSCS